MNKIKELTDFYLWMKENDYDHNIRARVEKKAEMYLNSINVGQELPIDSVVNLLNCWVKDTVEEEKILVRESENGLKYLIFDDESISYARVGKKIGEHETIHFDETNGKNILEAFINDN